MHLRSIWRLRCSHCLRGQVFASFWRANEHCPVCGIRFERERGYFMMAIFVGYVLNGVIFLPLSVALYLARAPLSWYIGVVALIMLLAPFIFRYARVIWLHVDERLDPRPDPIDTNSQAMTETHR